MANTYKLKRISDGREYTVGAISMLIGRSDSCNIQVTEGHPSREHARISEKAEGLVVQDLHSTNGTFVNNQQIDEATVLKEGDIVKFGAEAFSVQLQEHKDATVFMRAHMKSPAAETIIEEDDEDDGGEDSTSFIQLYTLPPGWREFENEGKGGLSDADIKKKQAIDRYVEKFSASLKGKKGLILLFFTEDNLPTIKVVSSKEPKTWSLGRNKDCDVVFEHSCISKHHANVVFDGSGWEIQDNASTNGISVDGRKQEKITLQDDMKIKIVSVELLVRLIG
ncbi:FHA domain-containing protein FhaB [Thalassocella blandensis]|nr:FHA domain-containing protein FhaB [Thalassocella blandensis]